MSLEEMTRQAGHAQRESLMRESFDGRLSQRDSAVSDRGGSGNDMLVKLRGAGCSKELETVWPTFMYSGSAQDTGVLYFLGTRQGTQVCVYGYRDYFLLTYKWVASPFASHTRKTFL